MPDDITPPGGLRCACQLSLKQLKPKEKSFKVAYRDGLYIHGSIAGALSFRLDYRLTGRREMLTFGAYGGSGMSLALAREMLIDAKRRVSEGRSPAQEKKCKKRQFSEITRDDLRALCSKIVNRGSASTAIDARHPQADLCLSSPKRFKGVNDIRAAALVKFSSSRKTGIAGVASANARRREIVRSRLRFGGGDLEFSQHRRIPGLTGSIQQRQNEPLF